MENFEYINYEIRGFERNFKKNGALYDLEKVLFKFFRNTIKANDAASTQKCLVNGNKDILRSLDQKSDNPLSVWFAKYEMINAQLTTEIFGLYAPARPDIALKMAHVPIQTTARNNAEWISEYYVLMYSLASYVDDKKSMKDKVHWMAGEARKHLPNDSYSAKMYDFVKSRYDANIPWEQARDEVYQRYQVDQLDGYNMTAQNKYCNGCFAGGINFASSIVSLLYGEGDIVATIKIGALAGWDSDNPTATWGGMLGFMLGKEGVEKAFGRKFADRFNIHRTRTGFPNNGIDDFLSMAKKGVYIVDRVVQEEMGGGIDLKNDVWYIPATLNVPVGR